MIRALHKLLPIAASVLLTPAIVHAQQTDSVTRLLNRGYDLRRAGHADSAATMFARALALDSNNARIARELGFALMAAGDTARARDAFTRVAQLAPTSRDDNAQLGYLDLALHDDAAAARAFEAALRAAPDDATLRLQLAYTYEALGRHDDARQAFERAQDASDTTIIAKSHASLNVLAGDWYASPGTPLADWYAAAQYGTRFDNLIANADAHAAVVVIPRMRLEAYVVGHAVHDTRSSGGVQPVIFSDNYAFGGAGVRARPFPMNLTLYAEGGASAALMSGVRAGAEGRYGANYGAAWRPLGSTSSWSGDLYADASYYSRYSDMIGYGQARLFRSVPGAPSWLDAYVRDGIALDGRGLGYNNLDEIAAGVRVHGGARAAAALYAEVVEGFYLRGNVDGGSRYTELRLTVATSGFAAFIRR